jgi:hypothetical protein
MSEGHSTSSYTGMPLKPTPEQPAKLVPTANTIFTNWRSTLSGILTALLATGTYFSAVPSATLITHGISQNTIFWMTVVDGLATVYLHMISKDAK